MKNLFIIIIATYILSNPAIAQNDLYMPIEIQKAYKNGTRSLDGMPGVDYWQNFSRYNIDAEIEPGTWKISGSEKVVYFNNSNDSLHSLIIKTYPNHFKRGGIRDGIVPLEDLTDGMILKNLRINDEDFDMADKKKVSEHSTFIQLSLQNSISPHDSAIITVDWETELPPVYENRIGAYDSSSAFMGYWYPQIGVYDDIDGWDIYEYRGTQEFNRDYADFKVNITVPADYMIWATGELMNKSEVLSVQVQKKLAESKVSGNKVIITEGGDYHGSDKDYKTWNFSAENVQDFAAGISNYFRWEASTIKAGDKTIYSNLVYDPKDSSRFSKLLGQQNLGLLYYSDSIPGIVFPYKKFTTFMGVTEDDGMEFPMIANNGVDSNKVDIYEDVSTAVHEAAHMYFPYYVGINEVKYAWMEEGMASFLELVSMKYLYKDSSSESHNMDWRIKRYISNAGKGWETPMIGPSNQLVYRFMHSHLSYTKPAIMYLILMDMLGKERFTNCYQSYIRRWAGKHPTPYDFMFTFNDVSKQNLNWFWKPWIFEFGYPDIALKRISDDGVTLEMKGNLPVPVDLKLTYENGNVVFIHETAALWKSGAKTVTVLVKNAKSIISGELLNSKVPDIDETNNIYNKAE